MKLKQLKITRCRKRKGVNTVRPLIEKELPEDE